MRLRNVKGSRETIAANPLVIHEVKEQKGHWTEVFENDQPLYIEIDMGKGQFIIGIRHFLVFVSNAFFQEMFDFADG